ncbi:nuclease-related domain-containing protein [Bailinhaonella thermotolerans]|uniref:nuclease-related domain-containing protein n=1 Tax=Bailinhaonella thermotolerans TaxID=1070861 RepID=UPI001F5B2B9D|nr:nuclease-related domain-containing protein [Bailinhaonella thermotolerans]
MEPANAPRDGHSASPIWVNDRPEDERDPKRQVTTTYAPIERASLLGLIRQPQYRHWRIRLAIAAGVGLVVTVLTDWRLGLTAAVLTVIADTVQRARSTSSIEAWRRASAAERRTEAQLRKLERVGYRALHARAIPGSDAQIDHLVIGPTGVYAVDSEKWDRRLPVRAMSHRKLFHGPHSQKPRLDEARWEADRAAELIGQAIGREVQVVPSLAIYGPTIPWKILNIRDVDVFEGGRVRKWITKREKTLTATEIERIARAAENVLPPRYPTS